MANKCDPIAVFDSGVGGLSVLSRLRWLLPQEKFLYFGDTANAPYGVRTTAQVQQLTLQAAQALTDYGIKALVVACNTATAAAIRLLRSRYPDLIVVGIEPALKLAADHYPNARVGVLATPLTLREEKFSQLSERFSGMQVCPIALPGLVEQIESEASDEALESFLAPVLGPYAGKLDAAVLGCTHYPFAAGAIGKLLGSQVRLLDGAEGTARQTRRLLAEADLLSGGPGGLRFLSSGSEPDFACRCTRLLEKISQFER